MQRWHLPPASSPTPLSAVLSVRGGGRKEGRREEEESEVEEEEEGVAEEGKRIGESILSVHETKHGIVAIPLAEAMCTYTVCIYTCVSMSFSLMPGLSLR